MPCANHLFSPFRAPRTVLNYELKRSHKKYKQSDMKLRTLQKVGEKSKSRLEQEHCFFPCTKSHTGLAILLVQAPWLQLPGPGPPQVRHINFNVVFLQPLKNTQEAVIRCIKMLFLAGQLKRLESGQEIQVI